MHRNFLANVLAWRVAVYAVLSCFGLQTARAGVCEVVANLAGPKSGTNPQYPGPGGAPQSIVQARDGRFYFLDSALAGVEPVNLLRMTPSGALTVLQSFSAQPEASASYALFRGADGNVYGFSSRYGGYVFRVAADGSCPALVSLGVFRNGSDARSIILSADGNFYGGLPAEFGNSGGVFKATHGSGAKLIPSTAGMDVTMITEGIDKQIYGIALHHDRTYGIVDYSYFFVISVAGEVQSFGEVPVQAGFLSTLVQGPDGSLFGGVNEYRANYILKVDSSRMVTTFVDFARNPRMGSGPTKLVFGRDGVLYGIAADGGLYGGGTFFRVAEDGSGAVPVDFSAATGSRPVDLVQSGNGLFYALTEADGAHGKGTVVAINPEGVQTYLLGVDGEPAPGLRGAIFTQFGEPALNARNRCAFRATAKVPNGRAGFQTVKGIWSDNHRFQRAPVAVGGWAAPGIPGGTFASFSDPVIDDYEDVAFVAQVASGSETGGFGVWSTVGGVLSLVARTGAPATGAPDGVFFNSFEGIALPDGCLVIYATTNQTSGGAPSKAGHGIWVCTPGNALRLVAMEGVEDPATGKIIEKLRFLSGDSSVAAQTRGAQTAGDIAYEADFTDGTAAILKRTQFESLASLGPSTGEHPSDLTQGADGALYGSCSEGGANLNGTLFRVNQDGGIDVLYDQNGLLGGYDLLLGGDGNLYGSDSNSHLYRVSPNGEVATIPAPDYLDLRLVTPDGAIYGEYGDFGPTSIYVIDPSGNIAMYPNGGTPYDALVHANPFPHLCNDGGTYFGTAAGDFNDAGSVIGFPSQMLVRLPARYSPDGVAAGQDGNLYGTANGFGGTNSGIVYKATLHGEFSIIAEFTGLNGANPLGQLILGQDATFYGVTSTGGPAYKTGASSGSFEGGTLYSVTPSGQISTLMAFTPMTQTLGLVPNAPVAGADGAIYGSTQLGGRYNGGTIFRYYPAPKIGISVSCGDSAPGANAANFAEFNAPINNANNAVCFRAGLAGQNVKGIWAERSRVLTLIAKEGDSAPALLGNRFQRLGDPVFNVRESVAFAAGLAVGLGDTTPQNDSGVWLDDGPSQRMIARKGAQAPDCPAGAVFDAFTRIVLPDNDQLIFTATLKIGSGGVAQQDAVGLWALDRSGHLRLIQRNGASASGHRFGFLNCEGRAGMGTRGYSQFTGSFAYSLKFDGDRSAIVLVTP